MIFHRGLFRFSVAQAYLSCSFSIMCLNPACSIPSAKPPAPAKSSILVYSRFGFVPNSVSQREFTISDTSGMSIRSSESKYFLPDLSVLDANLPLCSQRNRIPFDIPSISAKFAMLISMNQDDKFRAPVLELLKIYVFKSCMQVRII